jgi:hypothetical protein
MFRAFNSPVARNASTLFGSLLVLCVSILFLGCGASTITTAKNSISGTVTYKGQPVAGEVVFVSGDNKEIVVSIGDEGRYIIDNLPKGELQILVRGTPKQTQPKGVKVPADTPSPVKATGVDPPVKYAQLGNGLKLEVSGGVQTKDIPLE